jgi:hypothetical protein
MLLLQYVRIRPVEVDKFCFACCNRLQVPLVDGVSTLHRKNSADRLSLISNPLGIRWTIPLTLLSSTLEPAVDSPPYEPASLASGSLCHSRQR